MTPNEPISSFNSVDISSNWASEARALSPLEQAYNFILEGILSGELAPGMHIPTEAIAERLGISRMPVRDALRRLEGDGAITIYANRGAVVAEYSKDEVIQLVEMRAVLEGLGARFALSNITQRELDEINHLQIRMDRSTDDLGQWIVHHDAFHNYITSLSGRPLLTRQTKKIRLMLRPSPGSIMRITKNSKFPGTSTRRSSMFWQAVARTRWKPWCAITEWRTSAKSRSS